MYGWPTDETRIPQMAINTRMVINREALPAKATTGH